MDEPQNDPSIPNLIWARRPELSVPSWVPLVVHPDTVRKWAEMKAWSKIGEFAGLVHGRLAPGRDGTQIPGTAGLMRPTAVFRGLKRPLHDGEGACDHDMLIYVTNPARSYEYAPRHMHNGLPEVTDKPIESVFTTFVSFRPEHVDAVVQSMVRPPAESVLGVVTFWEWTEASRLDLRLPYEYDSRYEERLV